MVLGPHVIVLNSTVPVKRHRGEPVSQSVSYFTVPPRAHPSTGSQSGTHTGHTRDTRAHTRTHGSRRGPRAIGFPFGCVNNHFIITLSYL